MLIYSKHNTTAYIINNKSFINANITKERRNAASCSNNTKSTKTPCNITILCYCYHVIKIIKIRRIAMAMSSFNPEHPEDHHPTETKTVQPTAPTLPLNEIIIDLH